MAWVAVLGRRWVAGTDIEGRPRQEIEWIFQAVLQSDASVWPESVRVAIDGTLEPLEDAKAVEASPHVEYAALVKRVDERGQ